MNRNKQTIEYLLRTISLSWKMFKNHIFVYLGVVYTGEDDVCGVIYQSDVPTPYQPTGIQQ